MVEAQSATAEQQQHCISYLGRLFSQRPAPNLKEKFEKPYRDFLQSPLQPLFDNLEAETYETFEKDPIKYVNYEDAVFRAAIQKLDAAGDSGSEKKNEVTIVVAGAGRGPLVQSSINAVERILDKRKETSAGTNALPKFRIACIEKNRNAVFTLKHRRATEELWQKHNVEIYGPVDMRA